MIVDCDPKIWGPYAGKVALIYKRAAENRTGVSQPKNRANFEALHKKQNVKFLQDTSGKRGDRGLEMQGMRKERRSEMFMKGRKDNIAKFVNKLSNHDDSHDLDDLEDNSEVIPKSTNVNSRTKNGSVDVNGTRNGTGGLGKPGIVKTAVNSSNASSWLTNKNNTSRPGTASNPIAGPSTMTSSRSNAVISDSRKDQLSKWKREKAAAELVTKKDQKAPFKAGVSTIKPASNAGLSKNCVNFGNGSVNASRIGFRGKAVGTTSTSGVSSTISRVRPVPPVTSSESLEGRRVTRAMTKGQPAQPNSSSNVILNSRNGLTAGVKPAITKMTTLTISGKTVSKPGLAVPGSLNTNGVSQTAKLLAKPVPGGSKKVVQLSSTSTVAREDKPIASTTTATIQEDVHTEEKEHETNLKVQDQEKVQCVIEPKTEAAPKKKAKPRPIDATYIEYNAQFSTACVKLKSYSVEWTKIFEDGLQLNNMPQDVEGDIQSALGKVKLLLDSKLPQFGELLFSYLCPQADTIQILACDLEGWWDVASIQLNAVDTLFEGLHKLKAANWVKVAPVSVKHAAPSLNPNDDKLSREKISRPRIKSSSSSNKAAASGGLKAFLANKRKMINNNAKTDDATEVKMASASPATTESNDNDADADKTFDGGFFSVISSPMRTPVRTPSRPRADPSTPSQNALTPASAVRASLRTPGRRQSSTGTSLNRMSLCILGVRKSMGSFNKIGVKPLPTDDQGQNEKCNQADA